MNDERADTNAAEKQLFAVPPELQAFEAELAELRPRSERLQRERLAFLAGQAAGSRSLQPRSLLTRWAWPLSTLAFAALSAALVAAFLLRPSTVIVERIVYVPGAAPTGVAQAETPSLPTAEQPSDDTEELIAGMDVTDAEVALFTPAHLARLRVLDHLWREPSYLQTRASASSPAERDPLNRAIWSVRSLSDVLNESTASSGTPSAFRPHTGPSSGANS